jgi:hypothetical protein
MESPAAVAAISGTGREDTVKNGGGKFRLCWRRGHRRLARGILTSKEKAMKSAIGLVFLFLTMLPSRLPAADSDPLAVGVAGHAFDHLGNIGEQADAAAASGATIIYSTGLGGVGYTGLPPAKQLAELSEKSRAYIRHAKSQGIRLAIGYVCATSIVNLPAFDKNWTEEFRSKFKTSPDHWLQQDRTGKPLPSWYGGDYRPACMNNPDWRAYQKQIVRLQLDAGHDGIFFDNPTVHPNGCYCEHCMKRFAAFVAREHPEVKVPAEKETEAIRTIASARPKDFLRFRASIAADFLTDIRSFARTINPKALITCNNSLNAPEAFFSQCRSYGYNIHALSEAEDLVVVEDQATQPRTLANGAIIEYGPVYEMLHAISHGRPVVAVTISDSDYHTPPNLMRLAMAEAAAHGASYLSWPTWPENQRQRMSAAVRPQADLLRVHADLLNDTRPVADVALFLPFSRWVETPNCQALSIARELSRANVQFQVYSEESLSNLFGKDAPAILLLESQDILPVARKDTIEKFTAAGGHVILSSEKDWLSRIQSKLARPAIKLTAPPTVRALIREKGEQTIVHLLNLDVRRISSFEDQVNPAVDVKLQIRCRRTPTSIKLLTVDEGSATPEFPFTVQKDRETQIISVTVPRLAVSAILVLE